MSDSTPTLTRLPKDDTFAVETIRGGTSPLPNQAVYLALHQDYSEEAVSQELAAHPERLPTEQKCGQIILKRLLSSKSLHAGPLEHAQLQLNFCHFPHSTMQQLRTHRVGITFDVQSFRYTGERILDFLQGERSFDEVFYIRPPGRYLDRQGNDVIFTPTLRQEDIQVLLPVIEHYGLRIRQGFSPEHARSVLPFDTRQSWVMTANARTIMHLLDMRWPADAQHECQQAMALMFKQFELFMPEVADWYQRKRARKSLLSF